MMMRRLLGFLCMVLVLPALALCEDKTIPIVLSDAVYVAGALYGFDGYNLCQVDLDTGEAEYIWDYQLNMRGGEMNDATETASVSLAAFWDKLALCDWKNQRVLVLEEEGLKEKARFLLPRSIGGTLKNPVFSGKWLYMLMGEDTVDAPASLYCVPLDDESLAKSLRINAMGIAPWSEGRVLATVLQGDTTVITAVDAQGNATPLATLNGLAKGLVADAATQTAYIRLDTVLYRLRDGVLTPLRTVDVPLMVWQAVLLEEQYMMSCSEGCVLWDLEEREQTPLVIRGQYSAGSDYGFSAAYPEIGLQRTLSLTLTAEDVYKEILMGGDDVDLYYLPYSSSTAMLLEKGYAAALPGSEALQADHMRLYDVYANCLQRDGTLLAVVGNVTVGTWSMDAEWEALWPQTMAEAIDAQADWARNEANVGQSYLNVENSSRSWTALDWMDVALTQVLLARDTTACPNLQEHAALRAALEEIKAAYEAAGLPLLPSQAQINGQPPLLRGTAGGSTFGLHVAWWDEVGVEMPRIFEDEPMRYQAVLMVYILNPRSSHVQEAITYLNWLTQHRSVYVESLLYRDATPKLFESSQQQLDALPVTEEAERERLLSDRLSWQVWGPMLEWYRERILPNTVVLADALLEGERMTSLSVYDRLLEVCERYLTGNLSLDQALREMQRVIDTWWMENQ